MYMQISELSIDFVLWWVNGIVDAMGDQVGATFQGDGLKRGALNGVRIV